MTMVYWFLLIKGRVIENLKKNQGFRQHIYKFILGLNYSGVIETGNFIMNH